MKFVFYALTESSLFEVTSEDGWNPSVLRIARTDGSKRGVGKALESKHVLLVTRIGLLGVESTCSLESLTPNIFGTCLRMGPGTGPIVGLFVDKARALEAAACKGLRAPDDRFRTETLFVLTHIRTINEIGRCPVTFSPYPELNISFVPDAALSAA